MFFLKSVLVSAGLLLTLTSAFNHTQGTPDGVYLHHIDEKGNEVTTYAGTPQGAPHPLQQVQSAKLHARDSTPPGSTTCTTNVINALDLSYAQSGLAAWCSTGQQFYSAVSYVSGSANAYVCAYNGKKDGTNTCDMGDAVGYFGLIGGNCVGSRSGYYMIPKWGLSYGYDLQTACFCHC